MSDTIRQILYASVARASNETGVVDGILTTSRRNNARDQVTGLLYADGGRYVQALEGAPDMVEATFERIRADERHHSVEILSDRELHAREFGTWSMAFYGEVEHRHEFNETMRRALMTASPDIRARFLDLIDD